MTQKVVQFNQNLQTKRFKIDSAFESAKDSKGGFKNIPHIHQLQSGVVLGKLGAEVAVQRQRSVRCGYVGADPGIAEVDDKIHELTRQKVDSPTEVVTIRPPVSHSYKNN